MNKSYLSVAYLSALGIALCGCGLEQAGSSEDLTSAGDALRISNSAYGNDMMTPGMVNIDGGRICAVVGWDHALKCWGYGGDGMMGYGDNVTRGDNPGEMGDALGLVDVSWRGRLAHIWSVSGRYGATCVTRSFENASESYVSCWGFNTFGELGLGDTAQHRTPVAEPPVRLPGTYVAAGAGFVCRHLGFTTHGSDEVRCLGLNDKGQLGYGDTINRGSTVADLLAEKPVPLGTGRTPKQVVAAYGHACALLDNGQVKCWGDNYVGQLGLGDTLPRGDQANELGDYLPAVNLGTGRTAKMIAAGSDHTCAILDNNQVKCWGGNVRGELGIGSRVNQGALPSDMGDALPAVNLGDGLTATWIQAAATNTCVILNNGQVKCWGENSNGQLGIGDWRSRGFNSTDMGNNLPAVDLTLPGGVTPTVVGLWVGVDNTCAALNGPNGIYHQLKCWGKGDFAALGQGDTVTRGDEPGEMGTNLPRIDLGSRSSAAINQVAAMPDARNGVPTIVAGNNHACAILNHLPFIKPTPVPAHEIGGPVKCWGRNNYGQLGLGNTTDRGDNANEMSDSLPFVDLGPGRTAIELSLGANHTCALLDDFTLKCWGANSYGQLGLGDTQSRGDNSGEMGASLPAVSVGTSQRVYGVSAGANFTCVMLDTLEIKCWGQNSSGQLGRGDSANIGDGPGEMGVNLPAVDLGVTGSIFDISAGDNHVCVNFTGGRGIKCWGANTYGQLGLGDTRARGNNAGEMGTALPFVPGTPAADGYINMISTGANHTCWVSNNTGGLGMGFKCWGRNRLGQLGYGDTTTRGNTASTVPSQLAWKFLGMSTIEKLRSKNESNCVLGAFLDTDNVETSYRLKCWGDNSNGQLGLGDKNNRGDSANEVGTSLPYIDLGLNRAVGVGAIAIGNTFMCAMVAATGQFKCWGTGTYGTLGNGMVNTLGDSTSEMGNALPIVALGTEP